MGQREDRDGEGRKLGKGRKESSNTDTDVESTQSTQKGQIKSIFLSDSNEEAIVEFVKQQRQAEEKKPLGDTLKHQELTCQHCEEVVREPQCTRFSKLTQTKSGQATEKSTE